MLVKLAIILSARFFTFERGRVDSCHPPSRVRGENRNAHFWADVLDVECMNGNATISVSIATEKAVAGRGVQAIRLAGKLLLVGFICYVSTEVGFAHKVPPHNISTLWPTGAILFGILVVAPVRHWWAYAFAAYFASAIKAGVNVQAFAFLAAALIEVFIAAAAVRRLPVV